MARGRFHLLVVCFSFNNETTSGRFHLLVVCFSFINEIPGSVFIVLRSAFSSSSAESLCPCPGCPSSTAKQPRNSVFFAQCEFIPSPGFIDIYEIWFYTSWRGWPSTRSGWSSFVRVLSVEMSFDVVGSAGAWHRPHLPASFGSLKPLFFHALVHWSWCAHSARNHLSSRLFWSLSSERCSLLQVRPLETCLSRREEWQSVWAWIMSKHERGNVSAFW